MKLIEKELKEYLELTKQQTAGGAGWTPQKAARLVELMDVLN